MPRVMLIMVIGALCFSAGEGLRLTPFSLSRLIQVEATNVPLDAKASPETSVHKYGPLDVPTQIQKRSKRQAVNFACPPCTGTRELPSYLGPSFDYEPFRIVSVVLVSRPAGRAPPVTS